MRNKLLLIVLIMALIPMTGYSQKNEKKECIVTGIVVDKTGESIPGVTIYVKNAPGVGTSTDLDGKFSIKVDASQVLVIQYIGMKPVQKLITKSEKNLKITLEEDDTKLDEVVVTGMTSQKKVSVVGAISTIDVAQLKTPGSSLNNMIGGRLAGVITMQSSGEPGKNISNFWIRGISTFGASSGALVLIDGIEGRLEDVDPDDVKSFSILKDASATAVYGTRGANGVVLVTTKRGESGKLSITGRATLKISHIKRLPEYLGAYDYALLANEARAMSGEDDLYSRLDLDLIKYGLDKDLYPDVNWMDEIMKRNSLQQNYYINAQGGGDVAKYYLSVGYQDEGAAYRSEENIFKKPLSNNKLTYRANIDMNLTKTTKVYFGLDGYISNYTKPGAISTDNVWNAVRMLTPVMFPVRYSDGTLPSYGTQELTSPYTILNNTGFAKEEEQRNMITLKLEQEFGGFLKGLKASVQGMSENISYFHEQRFLWPDLYRATGRSPQGVLIKTLTRSKVNMLYNESNNRYRKYYMEAKADWSRSFEAHTLGALLLYYMEDVHDTRWDFDAQGINNIPKRRQNLSGRVSYGYNSCYFIDANFGYTGSAQFEKGKRYGFFPSIAIGWVPTAYSWVNEAIPWLSFLKFRGSYGQVGNDQISNTRFPYLTLINDHAPTYWGAQNSFANGITETVKGADNLQWEVATKMNFGVDAKFFNDKLSVTVDIFRDTRDHIFQDRVTLPQFVGMVSIPKSNVGKMHSYGSDGNFEFFHDINKDMNFTIRGNYTLSSNIIDYFEENKLPYNYLSVTGKPYDILRGYIAEGLFASKDEINTSADQSGFGRIRPGDIKYRDVNGDGIINADDQVPLSYSNQLPRLMYGFGGDFNWKDLTVSILFKGSAKVDYYRSGIVIDNSGTRNDAGWIPFYSGELGNVIKLANNPANRWTPAWYSGTTATENPNAEFPRLSYGNNTNNSQLSTFWKRNGSFLRLQEVSLRYALRTPWIKKAGLSSIDLEFVANNLFTIDKVKYFDPEQASRNGMVYPIPTTYTFQIYLKF